VEDVAGGGGDDHGFAGGPGLLFHGRTVVAPACEMKRACRFAFGPVRSY
jgi:hypothetical protein